MDIRQVRNHHMIEQNLIIEPLPWDFLWTGQISITAEKIYQRLRRQLI